LIVVQTLSSRSVITTTDVSSVGIRLSQSNSDSTRPVPTVRSILSFIDDSNPGTYYTGLPMYLVHSAWALYAVPKYIFRPKWAYSTPYNTSLSLPHLLCRTLGQSLAHILQFDKHSPSSCIALPPNLGCFELTNFLYLSLHMIWQALPFFKSYPPHGLFELTMF